MNPYRDSKTQSILKRIGDTQDAVQTYLHRVEVLEKKLKHRTLDPEERTKIEQDLSNLKEELKKKESELKNFYGENSKSFFVAVMLMFFGFLFYGLYVMIYGNPKKLT